MKQFRKKPGEPGQEALEQLSLERYSVEGLPTADLDYRKREALATSTHRHPTPGPVRSITLDPMRLNPHLVSLCDSHPQAAQQYGKLAVELISLAAKRASKRVLVTSAKHSEGRTSVLLNLAGALARAQLRVLVVDTDLFRPSVLRLLGTDVETGLPEGLARGLPLAEMAVKVLPFGFSLLATRSCEEHAVEVLNSATLRANLESLEPNYDFILFDSPPLLARSDARILLTLADGALLVVRPGVTKPGEMAKALATFTKEDVLGVVLNRIASLFIDE